MLDSEKALEKLEAEHPILIFVSNGDVTDILIPDGLSSRELEDREYIRINSDTEYTEEESMELNSIAVEDAGYISIPVSIFFNPYDIKYDDF